MKPLQFSQEKYNNAWLSKQANKSVTELDYNLRQIQNRHPTTRRSLNGSKTRLLIATLLTEYYSILFNPTYRRYFRPMYDLSLLLPTNEIISIKPTTNFILVPLPLPTYEERTDRGRYHDNCPFLKIKPNNDTSEFVRDLDYLVDSETYIDKEHIIWGMYKHMYHHTPRATKRAWTQKEIQAEARLFVYKYQDVPTYIAKAKFTNYPKYDIGEAIIPYGTFTPVFKKFTLLNIPKQDSDSYTGKIYYKLDEYSKQKLIPGQLDEKFADFFDFKQVDKQAIINYFLKHISSINEYSIPQIKSGIRKLNDIVKHGKPLPIVQSSISTLPPNDPKFDVKPESKRGRPKRGSQGPDSRVRYGKIYNPDGTITEYQNIDQREYEHKSIDQLKSESLFINNNTND